MSEARVAILTGAKAAHTLHRDLGVREQLERSKAGRVDVFSAIVKLGATLMFQPLDKLLGAYVPEVETGVLITTTRGLSVQRFTGAHELGHLYMKHDPSLDGESILRRAPFSTKKGVSKQEREADAFASMFLTPAWLIALNMERQKWVPRDLGYSHSVYQAALRFGTSYSATCYALERHKVISSATCQALLQVEPKSVKRDLLRDYEPPNPWSDVWLLTERDEGTFIEGGRNDLFVVKLRENSSAGYLWNFDQLSAAGFAVVKDEREPFKEGKIGGVVTRRVLAQSEDRSKGKITLREARPWLADKAIQEFSLRYDLRGPEAAGLWEPIRERTLAP